MKTPKAIMEKLPNQYYDVITLANDLQILLDAVTQAAEKPQSEGFYQAVADYIRFLLIQYEKGVIGPIAFCYHLGSLTQYELDSEQLQNIVDQAASLAPGPKSYIGKETFANEFEELLQATKRYVGRD